MTDFDLDEMVGGLHPLEIRLLRSLSKHADGAETSLAEAAGLGAAQFRRAAEWLLTKSLIQTSREQREKVVQVTERGQGYKGSGVPEDRIAEMLQEKGEIPMASFKQMEGINPQEAFSAIGALKERGIMAVDKGMARLVPDADLSAVGETSRVLERALKEQVLFSGLTEEQQALVTANVHKKFRAKGIFWLEEAVSRNFALTEAGEQVAREVESRGLSGEELSKLTPEMLEDGSWRGKAFRRYNIDLAPPRSLAARKHPYRSFLDYVKWKLISLGFEEMAGPLVESEFWNMDALFMPQFHSARDIQDVYFVKEPNEEKGLDDDLVERVARTHESGGTTSSRGWNYAFDRRRTRRLVLRSQTTAVSARTMAEGPKIPGKYFAMSRCFRYDTVDATHGCDFTQVEGIVLGKELDFKTLLGILKLFAIEVAKADEVVFAPSYFPFTEPSVEAHVKHPDLGWIEMGGAGIFRPEVTSPFGVDVPVLAWGLGLDRMAMVALGIKDIRDLFSRDLDKVRGQRIDMEMI
ncbi:MAG: phenylalanine--tRNA ligase subunit alpha [Planctomycetota bacterium]|jgi:phenylalanyl-tRNA synthetase alpha chain